MRCLVLLLCCAAASAQDYDRIIREAVQEQGERRAGDQPADRFSRAYLKLAEAVQLNPRRWEAYFYRVMNRVDAAEVAYGVVLTTLERARMRRKPQAELDRIRMAGTQFLRAHVGDASQDYTAMVNAMGSAKSRHQAHVVFAGAAIKFANREYEKGIGGGLGAIDRFKKAARAGFSPELCGDYIAKCYLALGADAFAKEEYEAAHRYWDEGLKWTKNPALRRLLRTNKAGAYELDHEFGRAEQILREEIEREPDNALHWKNLGLVLGFQHRLKEALYCYARCREVCKQTRSSTFLGKFHGNAWLRGAAIHGKLLTQDGDLRKAWRLFLEYRNMFGDDYNFALEFGSFAADLDAHDLAWTYLSHARDLQPHCPSPYIILVEIAPYTSGTPEEVRARIRKAKRDQEEALSGFDRKLETDALQRVCGGLHDWADGQPVDSGYHLLDPDPLAGAKPDAPPAWVLERARERAPFEPWRPGDGNAPDPTPAAGGGGGGSGPGPSSVPLLPIGVATVAALAAALLLFRRRASAA